MLVARTLPHSSPLSFPGRNLKNPNPNPNLTFPLSLSINNNNKSSFLTSCLKSSELSQIILPEEENSVLTPQMRVNIYAESLPFIQKFRGKTIVVKYGGAAMKSETLQASVITDLVLLSCVGIRIVFVHGGGPEINQWLGRLGIKPNFLNGLRVTDLSTMEIVSMVLIGKVNKHLVSLINKAGATAIGFSGIDGRLFTARPSSKSAQLGFVGEVASVNPSFLRRLIEDNLIPVIASVAANEEGQSYNINADTAAGELAAALGAEKLILLTDVPGILEDKEDPGSLVKEIDIKGVKKMMDDGKIAGGMIPKVNCCVRSLAQGVRTASIIDGRLPHSLLLEILTDEGAGTMITGEGSLGDLEGHQRCRIVEHPANGRMHVRCLRCSHSERRGGVWVGGWQREKDSADADEEADGRKDDKGWGSARLGREREKLFGLSGLGVVVQERRRGGGAIRGERKSKAFLGGLGYGCRRVWCVRLLCGVFMVALAQI